MYTHTHTQNYSYLQRDPNNTQMSSGQYIHVRKRNLEETSSKRIRGNNHQSSQKVQNCTLPARLENLVIYREMNRVSRRILPWQ